MHLNLNQIWQWNEQLRFRPIGVKQAANIAHNGPSVLRNLRRSTAALALITASDSITSMQMQQAEAKKEALFNRQALPHQRGISCRKNYRESAKNHSRQVSDYSSHISMARRFVERSIHI